MTALGVLVSLVVLAVHEDIVTDRSEAEGGVRTPAAVESALSTVSVGHFGQAPETLHETAAELIRLPVAEHPFVDGNKRTALTTAVVLYELNGFALPYDDERIRSILKRFGVDTETVDTDAVVGYLEATATSMEGRPRPTSAGTSWRPSRGCATQSVCPRSADSPRSSASATGGPTSGWRRSSSRQGVKGCSVAVRGAYDRATPLL